MRCTALQVPFTYASLALNLAVSCLANIRPNLTNLPEFDVFDLPGEWESETSRLLRWVLQYETDTYANEAQLYTHTGCSVLY